MTPVLPKTLEYYRLREEIEEFLYEEAALLDERHFDPGQGGIDIPNIGRTFLFELRQKI